MPRTSSDGGEVRDGGPPDGQRLHPSLLKALRVIGLGVIFAALLHDAFLAVQQSIQFPMDFASYYVPARALIQAPAINPYDFAQVAHLNATAHFTSGQFFPFVYPPVTLLFLRPLALLPFGPARLLWTLLSHAFAIGAALLLADAFSQVVRVRRRAAEPGREGLLDQMHEILAGTAIPIGRWRLPTLPFAASACAFLLAFPTADTYSFGQINLVVVFFLVLALHAHVHDRPLLAGFAVAVAGAMKLSPLFMLAFFLARGAWKALVAGVAFSAAFAAAPLVLLSPHVMGQFAGALQTFDATIVPSYRYPQNESLTGVLIQVAGVLHHGPALPQRAAMLLGALLAAAAVGGLLAASLLRAELAPRRAARPDRYDLDWLAYALLMTTYLLATPIVWSHYYVVALPSFLGLAAYPLLRRRAPAEGWTVADSCVMLVGMIALSCVAVQLPLDADHAGAQASALVAEVLRSFRVLGLAIGWIATALPVATTVRRSMPERWRWSLVRSASGSSVAPPQ